MCGGLDGAGLPDSPRCLRKCRLGDKAYARCVDTSLLPFSFSASNATPPLVSSSSSSAMASGKKRTSARVGPAALVHHRRERVGQGAPPAGRSTTRRGRRPDLVGLDPAVQHEGHDGANLLSLTLRRAGAVVLEHYQVHSLHLDPNSILVLAIFA